MSPILHLQSIHLTCMQQFGPGLAPTFLYYFSTTALVLSFLAAKALDLGIENPVTQQVGLIGGLIAGTLGAYFNRTTSFTRPIASKSDRAAFLSQLTDVMTQQGYVLKEQDGELYIYERPNWSRYLSGKVFVQFEAGTVAIASRAIQIKGLQRGLD